VKVPGFHPPGIYSCFLRQQGFWLPSVRRFGANQSPLSTSVSRIPVTVLAGYPGAGKTTFLNRILSENHGRLQRWLRWHHLTGLATAVFVLGWIGSG